MRVVVRIVSELFITAGALIVLFVVYLLFWTGVRADTVMDDQIDQLQDQWSQGSVRQPKATADPSAAPAKPAPYRNGKPFAIMYIPRLGFTWNKPVLEGTQVGTLKKGLGHYANTAQLGQQGNFSVAGHRRTYGDPFKDFPRLRRGDAVVLTDGTTWFTYRIDKGPYKTVPTDIEVIDPVPRKSGYTRPGRYLTLTTCDPEWGHSHRLIVWAHLDSTQPVEDGKPVALRR
ncbi:sortase A [Streptomyces sp. SAI-117]|uniref:class E sortase n=1 Tax=unclassified Streptomyces TaxID=2593676 RepID=UPI002476C9FC|nr:MULTISPECIES: class E sortase [unclassified Streptomyces]MDH6550069.1 sortase A [Streptomyces sp. SAI-041]MDH6569119.1 sortase A [Streptomyces sp. SAI-117]MDH6585926.1 sortase A [Streptomyces sp. SAI-133]